MALAAALPQLLALILGACTDGSVISCTLSGCQVAAKECFGSQWEACQCVITTCNDGNSCTTDSVAGKNFDAYCVHTAQTGASCSTGNRCKTAEVCSSTGTCGGGSSVPVDDANLCTTDSCDPATGVIHTAVNPDDGNKCTTDSCSPATGVTHTAVNPDDGNKCTTDSCDPATGVTHTAVNPDDGNRCTADACDPTTGVSHVPVVVDDGNPCTADACTQAAGITHTPVANGTACSTGNACLTGQTCTSGMCGGGTTVTVSDGNVCTDDACNSTTGEITHTPSVGRACSTGSVCDGAAACTSSGQCVAGTPLVQDDGDPCTADACDPVLGVRHTPIPGCGPQVGGMPTIGPNPLAQPPPQAPSTGGPTVVEHTGELRYSYVFDLPTARGRYSPVLALTYASHGLSDAGYGLGWDLTTSHIEADVTAAPSDASGLCRMAGICDSAGTRYWLTLNGQRALLILGADGKYRPEITRSRIEATRTLAGDWTVLDSVGNSYAFSTFYAGASAKGGRWYLTSVADVDGNLTAFSYLRDGSGAAAHVSSISYDAYGSAPDYATRVDLTYEQKLPARFIEVAGTISDRSWYLKQVQIRHQDPGSKQYLTLRGYDVAYFDYPDTVARARVLSGITVFGRDPSRTLPPTTFEYGTGIGSAYSLATGTYFTDPAVNARYRAWFDLDGDSKPDRLWSAGGTARMVWARNLTPVGAAAIELAPAAEIAGSEGIWVEPTILNASTSAGTNGPIYQYSRAVVRDFDGDGISDYLAASDPYTVTIRFGQVSGGVPSFAPPSSLQTQNLQQAWESTMEITNPVFDSSPRYLPFSLDVSKRAKLADVNGDGILDLTFAAQKASGLGVVLHGYRTATGWGLSGADVLNAALGVEIDVNADGRLDSGATSSYLLGEPDSVSPAFALTRVTFQSTELEVPIGSYTWGDCSALEDAQKECGMSYFPDSRGRLGFADLNGDGRADKLYKQLGCASGPCPIQVYWGSASGDITGPLVSMPLGADGTVADLYPIAAIKRGSAARVICQCVNWAYYPQLETTEYGDALKAPFDAEFIDLNADGALDYVTSESTSGVPAMASAPTFFVGVGVQNGRPLSLRAIATSTGARYDVTYEPATRFGASFTDAAPWLVASVSVSQPDGGPSVPTIAPNTTSYWYQSAARGTAWFEPTRKEPRGFAQTWVTDEVGRVVRSTTFATGSHAFTGNALQVEWGTRRGSETLPSGAPAFDVFRRVTSTYSARTSGTSSCFDANVEPPASAYPLVPVMTASRASDFLGGVTLASERTSTCTDTDDSGNVLRVRVDPDLSRVGDEYLNLATFDAGAACSNCVVETKATTLDGSPLARALYRYDSPVGTASSPLPEMRAGEGHLNYVSQWVSDGVTSWFEIASTTAYTANGNIAWRSSGPVTETFAYDAQERRVTTSTTSDGTSTLAVTTTYDPATGDAIKREGPYIPGSSAARATQALLYDTFGRLVATGRAVSGNTVTGALVATRYVDSVPPIVESFAFASPLSLTVGASTLQVNGADVASRADVRQVITYNDGLGRAVQVRERLGVVGTSDSSSGITSKLSGYRVSSAVKYDGAGRSIGVLEPFYDASATYRSFDAITAGAASLRRSAVVFDARGRVVCAGSGTWAVSTLGSSCTSSFGDDANYRVATRYVYGATTANGIALATTEAVPPGASRGIVAAYSRPGRLERTTDPFGNVTSNGYDLFDRPIATTRFAAGVATGITTTKRYDSLGRVIEEWDPNWSPGSSPSKRYAYDAQGRVTRVELAERTVAAGVKARPEIRYEYQSLGRNTRVFAREPTYVVGQGVTYSDRSIRQLAYDAPYAGSAAYTFTAGQISAITSPTTTVAFGYDQNGDPNRLDQWFLGLGGAFSQSAIASNDGRATSSTFVSDYSKSVTAAYGYDSALRPAFISVGSTALWQAVAADPAYGAYDALDRVLTTRMNGGTVTEARAYGAYRPDLASQAITAGSTSLYGFANIVYSGAKIRAFDDTSNGTRYGYSYDDNGRLSRATAVPSGSGSAVAQNFDEAYGFTADQWPAGATFGNVQRVTTFGADGSSTSRAYDHAEDRVTAVRIGTAVEKSLQYDDAGRVALATTGTSSRQTAYDVEDHLTAITPSGGPGEILAYDPTGTLMFRRVGTRVYYYTGSMTITGDVSASCAGYGCTVSNVKVEVHIVRGTIRIASIRAPAPSAPAAIDSDILYFHHDRQGSVIATTRNGGLIGERYRYTPYGALDKVEVVNANAHSDLAYLGGTQLSGSLLHLGARAYDPELRRFLQPDVVDLVRYGYGAGDPRNMMDPSGYMPISEEQQVNSAQHADLNGQYDVFYYSRNFDRPLDELPAGMLKAFEEGVRRYERQVEDAIKALGDKKEAIPVGGGLPSAIKALLAAAAASKRLDPQCFAQLKYRGVDLLIAALFGRTHAFWYVQGSDGEQYILSGYPTDMQRYLNVSVSSDLYGRVDNVSATTSWSSGLSSANCIGADAMIAAARGWPQNTIPYAAVSGPNSDTAAHTLGTAGGFNAPAPPGTMGWDTPLPYQPPPPSQCISCEQ